MTIRRILIIFPTLIIIILLQSYLWVPTYDQQTRGNPERLVEYINGSGGDASILNPILSADSTSSTIESMVFEGLIDRDENLRYRGRLATSWEIYEEAYFYINRSASVPGIGPASPQQIVDMLRSAKEKTPTLPDGLRETLESIRDITLSPPQKYDTVKSVDDPSDKKKKINVTLHVSAPSRIKVTLNRVDQDLFENLGHILGEKYFVSFPSGDFVTAKTPLEPDHLSALSRQILPATEHNPVLIFHLRPNVKFQDGHIFDAEDVKFTYESIMDPKNLSPRIADYEPVKSVAAMDPHTVKITYKRLYSPAIGTWGMGILPEHLLNTDTLKKEAIRLKKDPEKYSMRQSPFNRQPMGSGPFTFRAWKSDQYIVLDRFMDYWEGAPNYQKYILRIIPDLLTQEMEFYAGTLDSYGVQPHQVHRLQKDPRFQSFSGTAFGYTYIGYNLRRKPFDDPRIRRALGMAIDVDKIIKYVLYGQGERITGPFVKQTDFYDHRIKPLPYDPEGALKLLAEAGWQRNKKGWLEKDGQRLQFTLITNSGNDLRKAIIGIAQDAWKQIGIDVRTDLLEWSVFIQERINKMDFDALILGWQMGIDPDLYQIWHSSQTHPFQLNFVGFENRDADDLIVKIRKEYDHRRQVDFCRKLHEIIAREQPYTFLYVGKWTAVLDRRIVIKETDARGDIVYKKIKPTKTGSYSFYFNKWIKLSQMPTFSEEG
jgi:peptide/nickel transport system substrate-binding protein